jgi:hypothetical protein
MQAIRSPGDGRGWLGDLPRLPADETVNGVAALGLVKGKLVVATAEGVAPVADAIGPGNQQLAPTTAAELVALIPVDDGPRTDVVAAQPAPDLGYHGALIADGEFDLAAGRRDHG